MLKIKDNVDLKELEKFGIKKGFTISSFYLKGDKKEVMSIGLDRVITVARNLWWDTNFYYGYVEIGTNRGGEDILFDLIQAGLVEKV